ncbi:MAG: PQQ-like beta-propeller repeat protein [Candidatus Yanofskybacteria bacterium]|nr:PQQ-like beta-propeller repeat protein [Candidatus Yanofskybacteria bacterium]
MERIYLKPTCREVLHKDTGKEGHLDLFAYDYESDEAKRKLGNLYLVGNVHPALASKSGVQMPAEGEKTSENDVAYVTNLVASLAKREYYADPDLAPKEAFSLALKKVNDVVGEFFTNKDIKINIGIFAIAGEQINISKLGKFKIILSREDKNIDILNNIDLFTKERVQEKEFSHVVSGKVAAGDKIFAYYPGRLMTVREKYFKEYLLKLTGDQLLEKINSIKHERPDFSCAALYIGLAKSKGPTVAVKHKVVPTPVPEPEILPEQQEQEAETPKVKLTLKKQPAITEEKTELSEVDMPRIIRSEFSLGKKQNPVQLVFNKIRPFMPRLKNRVVLFVTLLGVIVASALIVKSLFILSPSERQAITAVEAAQESLKLARTKISQNDILGARRLLGDSLSSLAAAPVSSDKTEQTKAELLEVLDGIDQANEVTPALVESLPNSVLQRLSLYQTEAQKLQSNEYNIIGPVAFDIYENNLYVLTADNLFKVSDINKTGKKETASWLKSGTLPPGSRYIAVDGKIYVLSRSGILAVYYRGEKTGEYNTSLLSGDISVFATTKDSKNLYLINKDLNRVYTFSKENGSLVKTIKIGSNEPMIEAYLDPALAGKSGVDADETIYFSTSDGRFWKIQ